MIGVCSIAVTTSALNWLLMAGRLCPPILYAPIATRPPIGRGDTDRTLIGRDDGDERAGWPGRLCLDPAVFSTAR